LEWASASVGASACLDKIGFDGNGLTVGGDGIRAMSPIVQRAAQVVVRLGIVWPQGYRTLEQLHGFGSLAALFERSATIV
jgi:hypothetical protein